MSGGRSKLTGKQEAAIAALLAAPTHAQAAATARISEATLHRWLLLPEFKAAYRRARQEVVEVAVGQLQQASANAVKALERNLTCGKPGDEIRAAVAILGQSLRAIEIFDHETRLAALEQVTVEQAEAEKEAKL